jgi:hypothetical protein
MTKKVPQKLSLLYLLGKNENNPWAQKLLSSRSESPAEFSHGTCPDCAKKLYADLEIHNK